MLSPNTRLNERYRIIRPIGQGGMGAVYEAQDERLNNRVAVKEALSTIEPKFREAFEREAQRLARLRHPVLPKVIDHFFEGKSQYLVMEYIEGKDLAEQLNERKGPFNIQSVIEWADNLLDALTYLHTQKNPVIHRDIKPANLKLTSRGQIVLLDFGIATGGLTKETIERLPAFTPRYAPPEQMESELTDQRSDLYSLGATLYKLLTDRTPPNALRSRKNYIKFGHPDPLHPANIVNPDIPADVAGVLTKAMALEPHERYQSAEEMRQALKEAKPKDMPSSSPIVSTPPQQGESVATSPPPVSEQPSKKRLGWLLGLAALLLFLLITCSYIYTIVGPPVPEPRANCSTSLATLTNESEQGDSDTIKVGYKNFTEQKLLAQMLILMLKEAGYEAEDKEMPNAGTKEVREALLKGEIDIYWEYTGTALADIHRLDFEECIKGKNRYELFDAAKTLDEDPKYDLVWLKQAYFDNPYTLLVREETRKALELETLEDLADLAPQLTLCVDDEFYGRTQDGLFPLLAHYNLTFPEQNIVPVKYEDRLDNYEGLKTGQCDVVEGFGTDAQIASLGLHKLEDTKNFFPTYNPAPVIRKDKLDQYPELEELLGKIGPHLDVETMNNFNGLVDIGVEVDGQKETFDVKEVAQDFLQEKGLLECASNHSNCSQIVVGSKNFTEQRILGQMLVLRLRELGYNVVDKTSLGDTENVRAALENSEIDIYWEDYTGRPVIREEVLEKHSDLEENLGEISKKIEEGIIADLKNQVELDQKSAETVAKSFLCSIELLENCPEKPKCDELIINGEFENGEESWNPAGGGQTQYITEPEPVLLGEGAWRLGFISNSPADQSYSTVSQVVTIPQEAKFATLSYYYYPFSKDLVGLDFQDVLIDNDNYNELIRETSNEQAWTFQSHDLSQFVGQEVKIIFQVYEDGDGLPSAMYLDDVSLQVCK